MNRIHRIRFVQLRTARKVPPAGGRGRGRIISPDGPGAPWSRSPSGACAPGRHSQNSGCDIQRPPPAGLLPGTLR
jgi:hypothetical protein